MTRKIIRLPTVCGLSNYNYLSPALLVDFLKYAYSQTEVFQMLYKSLPVGGVDGTLKFRMKGTPAFRNVHAKNRLVYGNKCACRLSEDEERT